MFRFKKNQMSQEEQVDAFIVTKRGRNKVLLTAKRAVTLGLIC